MTVYTVDELEKMLGPEYSKDALVSIVADMEFTVAKNPASTYTLEILESEFKRAADTGVSEIDFSRKQIESIPRSLSYVVKLRKLLLNDCKLTSLPTEKFDTLTFLRIVELRGNSLTAFPSCFALPSVEIMFLDHNQIVDVPVDALEHMTGLKSLSMFANKLKTFKANVSAISSLRKLDLACNFIKTLDFDDSSFSAGFDLSIDPSVKTPSSNGSTPGKRTPKRTMTPKTPGSPKARAPPRSPRSPKATSAKSPLKKKRPSLSEALGMAATMADSDDDENYEAPKAKRPKATE